MQQIFHPHDNARVKTDKCHQMLEELGRLPARKSHRPNFLRGDIIAQKLLDLALNGDVPDPKLARCHNHDLFAIEANAKFTTAYQLLAGGSFVEIGTSDLAGGSYTLYGVPCALEDIIDLSDPDANFNPELDLDAGGVKPRDVGGGNYSGRSLSINEPLLSDIIANGCTAVFEIYADPATTNTIGLYGGDPPTYSSSAEATLRSIFPAETDDAVLRFSAHSGALDQFPIPDLGGGLQKVALTITASGMSGSVNGGAIKTSANVFLDASLTKLYFAVGSAPDGRLRSFAFYEPVEDADLPTLSAL